MGIQDRDWYRDAHKAREAGDITGYHHGSRTIKTRDSKRARRPLHPVWCVFLFIAISGGTFALLKLIVWL